MTAPPPQTEGRNFQCGETVVPGCRDCAQHLPDMDRFVRTQSFSINFTQDPITDDPDPINCVTSGHLVITADNYIQTRFTNALHPQQGSIDRPWIAANPLAQWLMTNWHRLH